jgi:mRNA-degrading endonuclease YafQ of YafQ-DinJ toxin-antitoxin module
VKTLKKPNQQQQAKGPDVEFQTCDLYNETTAEKSRAYPGLSQKISDFLKSKFENKLAPFGSSDKAFRSDGHFAGLKHAHLTPDLSMVYSIHSSNPTLIDLYGIFSHDELGTGQPPNINRQKSLGKRFRNQTFS